MTLSLHKKRRTTRPNTRGWTQVSAGPAARPWLGMALLLTFASPVCADESRRLDPAAQEAAELSAAPSEKKPSPLDRLKSRNAVDRWRDLNGATPHAAEHAPRPSTSGEVGGRKASRTRSIPVPGEFKINASPAAPARPLPGDDALLPYEEEAPVTEGTQASKLEDLATPAQVSNPAERLLPSRGRERVRTLASDKESTPRRDRRISRLQNKDSTANSLPVPVPYSEPVSSPSQLKRLTAIFPYDDYEPDPERAKQDPCQNLCPRPDGKDCPECADKVSGKGGVECAECPEEVRLAAGPYQRRLFPDNALAWEPTNIWYTPLYFEDVGLERYGHTRSAYFIQPVFSVVKFGVQVIGMPYQMTLNPPCKCVYDLGYYRPGDCVTPKYYQIPLNLQAAIAEAGVIAGAYYLFAPGVSP